MTHHHTRPSPASLAQCARRALTQAGSATLLIEGIGRIESGSAQILLADHEGRPRLVCEEGSGVVAAARARCPAILAVDAPICQPAEAAVIFAGHLALVEPPATGRHRDGFCVVELQLVSVILEIDEPDSPSVSAFRIPVEQYSAFGAPSLETAAETMRLHTNARHSARLRECAASRSGTSVGSIVEATLTAIDPGGADLAWIDADGANARRLDFPCLARDRRQLTELLRGELFAGTDGTATTKGYRDER